MLCAYSRADGVLTVHLAVNTLRTRHGGHDVDMSRRTSDPLGQAIQIGRHRTKHNQHIEPVAVLVG